MPLPIIAAAASLVGKGVKAISKANQKKKELTGTGFFAGKKKKAAAKAAKEAPQSQLQESLGIPAPAGTPSFGGGGIPPSDDPIRKYGLFALIGVLLIVLLGRR